MPADAAKSIGKACDRIIAGELHDQFVVDVFQGGAETSTNMNANEVIANLALEIMGMKKGEYEYVHPINHVNCSQSTNDAYPTAFPHRPAYGNEKPNGEHGGATKSFCDQGK